MIMKVVENAVPTAKQIAMRELEQEQQLQAVSLMKDKLMQLRKAQKIVANLEREIEDLELKIQDGIV